MSAFSMLKPAIGLAVALLLASCGAAGAPQPLFWASGRVVAPDGAPIAGAVVSDGEAAVLSDEEGHYAIGLFHPALSVSKPGFAPGSLEAHADRAAECRLVPADAPTRVALDTRSVGAHMHGLEAFLQHANYGVTHYPALPLERADVLLMPTPGALGPGEIASLRAWVRRGGRLVLMAEWGGFAEQDLATLDALGLEAGIGFTGATVKASSGPAADTTRVTVGALAPASLGRLAGDRPFQLFAATSLALHAPARAIMSSDTDTYAVLSRLGPQVVGAVGPAGRGKIFALGDAGIWLDDDTGAAGAPNWQFGGNKQLALALLQW